MRIFWLLLRPLMFLFTRKTKRALNSLVEYGHQGDRWTPLMIAVYDEKPMLVRAMIIQGADVNASDEHGVTALMQAAWKGNVEIINVLLRAGADLNTRNDAGRTAFAYAEANGHTEAIWALQNALTRE